MQPSLPVIPAVSDIEGKSETKPIRPAEEIRALTGIRGFAALAVVWFHFGDSFVLLFPFLELFRPLFRFGGMGVDLFFMLSGFILCHVYLKPAATGPLGWKQYWRFIWLRIARIYPVHLATLLFLVAVIITGRIAGVHLRGEYPLSDIPRQILMVHAWPFISQSRGMAWNQVSWSLSAEWFAYVLIFPLCYLLFQKRWHPFSILLVIYASLGGQVIFVDRWEGASSVIKVSGEFIAGAALWKICQISSKFKIFSGRVLLPTVVLAIIICYVPVPLHNRYVGLLYLLPIALAGLSQDSSIVSKFFGLDVAVWIGRISYALYMGHGIVIKFVYVLIPAEKFVSSTFIVRLCCFGLYWIAILASAIVLYYLVEIPCRERMRKLWR